MIRTETDGAVLTVTIDRPEMLNAMTREMFNALEAAFEAFEADWALRVAILTGAGDRAFCTGGDLGRISELRSGRRDQPSRLFAGDITTKPIVGAINGHALGGGLGLALLCDVRIGAENATFGCMGTARGVLPAAGQLKRLPEVVGLGNAMWLLLSGERIPAAEAFRIGLLNRLVPAGGALTAAREWAEILASRAPLAVQATKAATMSALDAAMPEALAIEARLGAPLFQSNDAAEGMRAFAEGRPAIFTGE